MIYNHQFNIVQLYSNMDIDESDVYEKNLKYDIIKLCGTKYKIVHLNSSSKNNKCLICLGQIKYFIKKIYKTFIKLIVYIQDILSKLFEYILDIYSEIILLPFALALASTPFLILYIVLNEIVNFAGYDFISFYNTIYTIFSLLFIIAIKISLIIVCNIVFVIILVLVLSSLGFIYCNIINIIIIGYNHLYTFFNKFYKQIPQVEEIEDPSIV